MVLCGLLIFVFLFLIVELVAFTLAQYLSYVYL